MVHIVGGGARLCYADIDCPGREVYFKDPKGNYVCVRMDSWTGGCSNGCTGSGVTATA